MADAVMKLERPRAGAKVAVLKAPTPLALKHAGYPGARLSTFEAARLARHCVADVLQADPLLLMAKPRGSRQLAVARQFAIHLVHIVAGRAHEDVARAFGRNRSTASHHFEIVEDLRDVPEFETFIGILERRYALLLEMAELKPRQAWLTALAALVKAVDDGDLEGAAVDAASYMAETFKADTGRADTGRERA